MCLNHWLYSDINKKEVLRGKITPYSSYTSRPIVFTYHVPLRLFSVYMCTGTDSHGSGWPFGSSVAQLVCTNTTSLPSPFIRMPYIPSVSRRGQNVCGCHMVPTFLILWDPGNQPSPALSRPCFNLTRLFILIYYVVFCFFFSGCGMGCRSSFFLACAWEILSNLPIVWFILRQYPFYLICLVPEISLLTSKCKHLPLLNNSSIFE